MNQLIKVDTPPKVCAHCGDHCFDPQLTGVEKSFCCTGCKAVYELLQDNGLEQYYTLENTPGVSLKNIQEEKLSYLDDPEVQARLLDFTDEHIAKTTFYIPDIHCASCIWLLENLYLLDKGIRQSKVNFLKKEIYITFVKKQSSLSKLVALLHRIGYPPNINLADLDKSTQPVVSKALYLKLGVSGFIFGNVMFMSFPEYLGLDKSIDSFYFQLFAYLNLMLGIPLVLYSGWDYLRSAFLGLRQGVLNIDVPISIGILSLFGRSAFEILSQTGPGYIDSLAGLIFFLLVGKWFQQKTYHSISFERDYQSYFPVAANKMEQGEEKATSLKQLKAGDNIRVYNQELIPADGILVKGEAYIDYSFVTGESAAVRVEKGQLIYAGGRQMGSSVDIQLTKAVVQSYLVQLWNEHSFENKNRHQSSSRLANQVGKYFTIAILLVAFSTLFYWLPIDVPRAINAFSAVLIIACPCAVALSIPFTFGNVLRILGRHHFYLKNTGVIESIQHITHIVFDKTGTLTERNENMLFEGKLDDQEKSLIKSLAEQSTHPRSQQIKACFQDYPSLPVSGFSETPGYGTAGTIDKKKVRIHKSEEGTSVSIDGFPKGYFKHEPKLRKGIRAIIHSLKEKYQLLLLSGDRNRHQSFFKTIFTESGQLHFSYMPKEKLQFIQSLQTEGACVMMIGDGLNDAGALQQADVGLVISEDNNNFSPACDGVVAATAFSRFDKYLHYIQQSRKVIFLSYGFALMYNIIGLSFAVQGLLSPVIAAILMPLSSVSIILLGMLGSWYLGRQLSSK